VWRGAASERASRQRVCPEQLATPSGPQRGLRGPPWPRRGPPQLAMGAAWNQKEKPAVDLSRSSLSPPRAPSGPSALQAPAESLAELEIQPVAGAVRSFFNAAEGPGNRPALPLALFEWNKLPRQQNGSAVAIARLS